MGRGLGQSPKISNEKTPENVGRTFFLLASTALVRVEGQRRVLVCLEDITSQKRAEERIKQQAALLDQTQDAILVADLDLRITYWNQSAQRFYSGSVGAAPMPTVDRLLFTGQVEQAREALEFTLLNGKWSGELQRAIVPGRLEVLESRWTLVRNAAGEPQSILILNTDISERKRLETQFFRAQRMEGLGRLASGVAHDLNNILAPCLMAVELLRPLARDTADQEIFSLLEASARRGADIVRQLLTFGRGIEGERVELQPRTLLKEMADVIRETFPKSITLEQRFPENLWTLHADATQVHQVLMNLCVNARDAMPRGGRLTLAAENAVLDVDYALLNPEAKPGPYVVLEVSDSGTGIAPEVIDKIFDPFFTTKDPGKGTGLGLATVLGIVKGRGGFMEVQSRLGQGTRFRAFLPASGTQISGSPERLDPLPLQGHGELVLLVDDEESIRGVGRRVLESSGYQVLTAVDGADGLAIFRSQAKAIQVLVTDMVMPILDGTAFIRAARQLEPSLRVVAMSGLHSQQEEALGPPLRADVFLSKPFPPEHLVAAVHKVLGSRAAL